MSPLRIGIVTVGDERKDFYNMRIHIAEDESRKLKSILVKNFHIVSSEIIYTFQQANCCVAMLRKEDISCIIIHLPIWGTPSLVSRIAQATDLPVVLLGNRRQDSSSMVALLAAAGMLDQIGKGCLRIAGDLSEEITEKKLKTFIEACHVVIKLRKSRYCAIGGRSIGIGTAAADPLQWQRLFGIDFDHCDQLELVSRARIMEKDKVLRYLLWLKNVLGSVQFGGKLTPESLERQVRSYLALKELAREREYDFMGMKCQTEMSDGYALQCLGVALMNGTFDADGEKNPFPVSCECDCDGALTMYILSMCGGGIPSSLMDIKYFSGETNDFVLANCGSMAPWFADRLNPHKALGQVNLLPHIFGAAGGGAVQFVAAQGHTTAARLCRNNGCYTLYCFEGESYQKPLEELRKTTWCYPHQFIRADINYETFFQTIGSNHLHTVYGSYRDMLKQICSILQIGFVCYNDDN